MRRKWKVIGSIAIFGDGLQEEFDWIISNIFIVFLSLIIDCFIYLLLFKYYYYYYYYY